MSQYPGGPTSYGAVDQYDMHSGEPARTSALAITALVCSLIFCCPITTLLGVLLGLIALASIGSDPRRKGRGLALAAIIIGLLLTIGWGFVIYNGYLYYGVLRDAPATTLRKGLSGDVAGFKADFGPAGGQVTDVEAQAFLDAVQSRLGNIQSSAMDLEGFQNAQTGGSGPQQMFYALTFDNGTRDAEVVFDPEQQTSDETVIFEKLIIHDPAGDLEFPPPSASGGATSNGDPADADLEADDTDPDADGDSGTRDEGAGGGEP